VPSDVLPAIAAWDAPHAAVAVVSSGGVLESSGAASHIFRFASVTKPLTACAVLVAAEEGLLDLDEPAGPPGATVRHLLAHASGLPFEGGTPVGRPGQRRIYSNMAYELLGALVAERAEMPFAIYLADAVLRPCGMATAELRGSPAAGVRGTLADLVAFARELLAGPRFVAPETFAEMIAVAFPGLAGVIPGLGRYALCDWGLGFELRDGKQPHWTGTRNSPATYGHFGGSGTFLWVDPGAGLALACLTDREFGPWALDAWPALSDAVLTAFGPVACR
jgi:CubicO group peptidase (beta-lactamase class C family)